MLEFITCSGRQFSGHQVLYILFIKLQQFIISNSYLATPISISNLLAILILISKLLATLISSILIHIPAY